MDIDDVAGDSLTRGGVGTRQAPAAGERGHTDTAWPGRPPPQPSSRTVLSCRRPIAGHVVSKQSYAR